MILFVFVSDKLSLVLDDKYREAVINLSLLFCVSVGWERKIRGPVFSERHACAR